MVGARHYDDRATASSVDVPERRRPRALRRGRGRAEYSASAQRRGRRASARLVAASAFTSVTSWSDGARSWATAVQHARLRPTAISERGGISSGGDSPGRPVARQSSRKGLSCTWAARRGSTARAPVRGDRIRLARARGYAGAGRAATSPRTAVLPFQNIRGDPVQGGVRSAPTDMVRTAARPVADQVAGVVKRGGTRDRLTRGKAASPSRLDRSGARALATCSKAGLTVRKGG
jgi:hypothetical protein